MNKTAKYARIGLCLLIACVPIAMLCQEDEEPARCNVVAMGSAVACKCVGMVSDVQQKHIEECERTTGGPGSKAYADCIDNTPDHCSIVSYPHNYGAGDHPKKCRTSCKPERCGCNDSSCRPHGQP